MAINCLLESPSPQATYRLPADPSSFPTAIVILLHQLHTAKGNNTTIPVVLFPFLPAPVLLQLVIELSITIKLPVFLNRPHF